MLLLLLSLSVPLLHHNLLIPKLLLLFQKLLLTLLQLLLIKIVLHLETTFRSRGSMLLLLLLVIGPHGIATTGMNRRDIVLIVMAVDARRAFTSLTTSRRHVTGRQSDTCTIPMD